MTVMIPQNQLQKVQDQDNEEGFSLVTKRKNQNKKKDKKKKQNEKAPSQGGGSN